ncbi:MAG: ABC transporter ATP-binding protein [Magnetococcales bacterium]|nr:ABC transporter ATP-binding protein [Magnetococcales bacterium]
MMPAIAAETEETRYGRTVDWHLMSRFLSYTRPHAGLLLLATLLVPINTLLQLAQPWVIKIAVDSHLVTGKLEGFATLLWILAGLILAQLATGYFQSLTTSLLGHRVVRDMRKQLFGHVLTLDAAYFAKNASGRITNRISNDTEAVSQMVNAGLVNLVSDLLLLAGIGISMVILSPKLSLAVLVTMPLLILATLYAARGLRNLQRRGRVLQSRMASQFTEEIGGHQVVRLFRRQEKNRQEFAKLNKEYLDISLQSNFLEAFQFSFVEAAATVVVALLFWYGGYLSVEEGVSIGVLVAFIEYIRRVFVPIRELSNRFTTMQAAMTALERIFDLLDTPPAVLSSATAIPPQPLQGEITFENVSFAYGGEPVLWNFSCKIKPGERVAVVGPTGAGKSTLIKLLNRTHDVSSGRVLLDGVDVRELPLRQLRQQVGVIAQETFLFAGTIRENISLGDPAISLERVQWAARQTGADTFIDALPKGYETPLAERGVNLSVGQRQLLGIARTLAFDPPILVMDEATSSVDTISERLIQRAMDLLLQGRTAIIVAHRLSTILDAHRILVLHQGRLEEEGTHAQLLAKGGIYDKLYTLQFQHGGGVEDGS